MLMSLLQCDSGKVETLGELLASARRQGIRAESLLKESDNLIQRYRNLEAQLQERAKAQGTLEEAYNRFNTQAGSTRTWIQNLLQPLTSPGRDIRSEEMRCKAQVGGSYLKPDLIQVI